MTKKIQIDMNSDVGESFGVYKLGLDEEVIPHITSANIACGFHAGDPGVMRKTVVLAKHCGVEVGAHPGYPDLMGFGRRNVDATLEEIQDYMVYQTGALQAFAQSQGLRLQHVKAHGSLYNMAVANPKIWEAMGAAEGNSIALAMSNMKASRPLTHDLIAAIFDRLEIEVARVVVSDLIDNTFYASLYLLHGDKEFHIGSRPSDAIAVAIRVQAPIFVQDEVLAKQDPATNDQLMKNLGESGGTEYNA